LLNYCVFKTEFVKFAFFSIGAYKKYEFGKPELERKLDEESKG